MSDEPKFVVPRAWLEEVPQYSIPNEPVLQIHESTVYLYNPDPIPTPDNANGWFPWFVFIPLQGTFVGDSELLRVMADKLSCGQGIWSYRTMLNTMRGGVIWKLLVTRALVISDHSRTIEPRVRQGILDLWAVEDAARRSRDRIRAAELAAHKANLQNRIETARATFEREHRRVRAQPGSVSEERASKKQRIGEPTTENTTASQPTAGKATNEKFAAEKALTHKAIAPKATTGIPMSFTPKAGSSTIEQAVTDKATTTKPTTETDVTKRATTEDLGNGKPKTGKSLAGKSAVEKSTTATPTPEMTKPGKTTAGTAGTSHDATEVASEPDLNPRLIEEIMPGARSDNQPNARLDLQPGTHSERKAEDDKAAEHDPNADISEATGPRRNSRVTESGAEGKSQV